MKIAGYDTQAFPLLIAEIGNNHEGSYEVACELVKRAAESGAGAVKFQAFRSDYYVSRSDLARHARLKSFELSLDQFIKLGELARKNGLLFIVTPFDLEIARSLGQVVDSFKIASGDNDFLPLIDEVCKIEKPLIISTGLLDLKGVERLVKHVRHRREHLVNSTEFAILHCGCAYPVPSNEANLLAIPSMQYRLSCEVGYSDHTVGVEAAIAAVALGATIIEKHFTLSKTYSDFRDHQLSADPIELKQISESIKRVAAMRGIGEKSIMPSEGENLAAVRRSIVAAKDLKEGHKIKDSDLTWIRISRGIAPGREAEIVGRDLLKDKTFGETIEFQDLK